MVTVAWFLLKNISREELLGAIRAVAAGQTRIEQSFFNKALRRINEEKAEIEGYHIYSNSAVKKANLIFLSLQQMIPFCRNNFIVAASFKKPSKKQTWKTKVFPALPLQMMIFSGWMEQCQSM